MLHFGVCLGEDGEIISVRQVVEGIYLGESVGDAFGLACGFEQARCHGDEDEEKHWGEYTALRNTGAEFDLGPRSLWGREVDACVFVE